MTEREILITIDQEGHVTYEVKGVSGPTCLDLTKDLLAGEVLEQRKTAEYHAIGQTTVSQVNKLGG